MASQLDVSPEALAPRLINWYRSCARPLPWRASRNPYLIWISEVMLQQTTVTAVVPYFERFTGRFPTLDHLANAREAEVFEQWSGLGYYSRARNLLRAAQLLNLNGFPKSYADLIQLPGFGPYTARAVASIAFAEPVGVVDGNVIRVLSRHYGLGLPWWQTKHRQHFQSIADALVQNQDSGEVNQALMELGASLCSPTNPRCGLCPWHSTCEATQKNTIENFPLKKPRRSKEIWLWQASVIVRNNKAGLVKNDYAPFLVGHLIWPGLAKRRSLPPKKYDFKHSITHHEIYIQLTTEKKLSRQDLSWIPLVDLAQVSPTSLMRKTLAKIAQDASN